LGYGSIDSRVVRLGIKSIGISVLRLELRAWDARPYGVEWNFKPTIPPTKRPGAHSAPECSGATSMGQSTFW
jgi:hypothetical protein